MGIQLVIGFLDLFKGSLRKNSNGLVLGLGCKIENWSKTMPYVVPLWLFSDIVTISFSILLSSLMFSILFLCFISITMSS